METEVSIKQLEFWHDKQPKKNILALEERIALRGLKLHVQTKRGDKGNVIIIVDKASYHAILVQVHTK